MLLRCFFAFLITIFLFSSHLFANDNVLKKQEVILKPGASITLIPYTTTTVSCLDESLTRLPRCELMHDHHTYYRVYAGKVWLNSGL